VKDLILTIDNGTQSLRALVFDAKGHLYAVQRIPFTDFSNPEPGWVEQDPNQFWAALSEACMGLWSQGVDKSRIAGVTVTTQRATVINLDRNGKPLRPAICWLDQRKTANLPDLGGIWGAAFKVLGLRNTIRYFQAEAEAAWLKVHQPELWEKTEKYLLVSGYLNYLLTGEYVDSVGSQVGYLPFDYKKQKWAADWDWKWKALPVSKSMLPKLFSPGEILGEVQESASKVTGIPVGLPVIAAAADKACEVLGSGSLEPSTGCLSYGTTATINVTHKKYLEPIPLLPAYPSAAPGYYTLEVQIYRGYWMVSWFKDQFGFPENQKAKASGVQAETLFDDLVKQVPPGSMGLMLQPYWSPGLRKPGPEAKGSIIGFGDVHTRAHVYRAILEGLAYALKEGGEQIEKKTGTPITELIVSGGGSQSDAAMQLTADIFGLPAIRPKLFETSGLGAAIDASLALGFHSDIQTAVSHMTHRGDVFEPNLRNHQLYSRLYNEVYKKMYSKMQPLYKKIRQITGYPG